MKKLAVLAVVGSAFALTTFPSTAMPISRPALDASVTHEVRLVCDRQGRCYQTRPRYRAVQRSYAPQYYAPAPSYYGHGPSYGYGPGYRQGPSIGFSFGAGPRW